MWNFQFAQAKACLRPYAVSALSVALLGMAALVVVAWAHYVLHPRWRIARRRLVALGPHRPTELMSFLDGLVAAAGLARPPRFWIALNRSKAQAVAFGTGRSHHIQLNAGLLGLFYDEPKRDQFAAVVLHELAHVRNRDIGYTYATIAVWRAFLIIAVLPFLALRVLPTVIGQPGGWAVAPMALKAFQPQGAWSMAALAALVFLTYYSILRARETQADITPPPSAIPGRWTSICNTAERGAGPCCDAIPSRTPVAAPWPARSNSAGASCPWCFSPAWRSPRSGTHSAAC